MIKTALEGAHLDYIDYAQLLKLIVFCSAHAPTGVFWQESPILWVHYQASLSKSVVSYPQAIVTPLFKAQKVALQTFGREPDQLVTSLSHQQLEWLQNNSCDWAIFLSATQSDFDNHYPSNNLVSFFKIHPLIFPKIVVSQPISKGCVVFTDGSSKGTAVVLSFPIIKTARITAASAQMA
ncbi:hypothetical protein ACQP3F_26025, partial [Escherichia coli]